MNALRTCAAVVVVAVSFVLVGCGNETIGQDEQDQTSATTFSASVSSSSTGEVDNAGQVSQGAAQVAPGKHVPVRDVAQY